MTIAEFIKKQNDKISEIEKTNKPLELAVRSIMSLQSKRIFIDGKNASDNIIGIYKGGEIYVSPNKNKGLPSFPLKGRAGKTEFENGKKHKTGYFKNYLTFKKTIGRNKNTLNVDLFLTGALSRNWANSDALTSAQATKVNQHNYIVTLKEENAKKIERYGNVFGLTKKEREIFLTVIKFELTKAMQ